MVNKESKVLFPFSNDYVCGAVVERNPEIAKGILKVAVGKYLEGIDLDKLEIRKQETVDTSKEAKGIRFDVYMKTDEAVFDLEMQTNKERDLVKRARYYLSVNDTENLRRGERYEKLPKTIIIFICTFDPFGLGYGKYVAEERLTVTDEKGKVKDVTEETQYESGYAKIFLNTKGEKGIDESLRNLLKYVETDEPTDELTEEMAEQVVEVNKTDREALMTLQEKYEDYEAKGMAKGMEKGMEKGLAEGKIKKEAELILAMYEEGGLTIRQIANITKCSEDKVREIIG